MGQHSFAVANRFHAHAQRVVVGITDGAEHRHGTFGSSMMSPVESLPIGFVDVVLQKRRTDASAMPLQGWHPIFPSFYDMRI